MENNAIAATAATAGEGEAEQQQPCNPEQVQLDCQMDTTGQGRCGTAYDAAGPSTSGDDQQALQLADPVDQRLVPTMPAAARPAQGELRQESFISNAPAGVTAAVPASGSVTATTSCSGSKKANTPSAGSEHAGTAEPKPERGSVKIEAISLDDEAASCNEPACCQSADLTTTLTVSQQTAAEQQQQQEPAATAAATSAASLQPLLLLQHGQAAGWRTYFGSELPEWLHDNEYLVAWHRPLLGSYALCLRTALRLHTETGNIWSHALGTIAAAACAAAVAATLPGTASDAAVFSVFLLTACGCFAASTVFHTFRCHSRWVARTLTKIDYCGIALLTVGSFVPWLYYAFYCDGAAQAAYLSAVVVLGAAAAAVYTCDRVLEPGYRAVRAASFVGVGLSGVVPAAHLIVEHGAAIAFCRLALGWLLLMAALYIGGACVYAARVPERWLPGRFDLVGHSHQWLHALSVAAVFVHLHGLRQLADFRLATSCPAPADASEQHGATWAYTSVVTEATTTTAAETSIPA